MVKVDKNKLVAYINRKDWWHVPPSDPKAYSQRGKFYSPTFRDAGFWGRPLDTPERVAIKNPVVGDESAVQKVLFGKAIEAPSDDRAILEWRWNLDARMKKAALAKGYDAIVIFSPAAFKKYKAESKIPRSIELNVLNPGA